MPKRDACAMCCLFMMNGHIYMDKLSKLADTVNSFRVCEQLHTRMQISFFIQRHFLPTFNL